jgi:hypothetical protein
MTATVRPSVRATFVALLDAGRSPPAAEGSCRGDRKSTSRRSSDIHSANRLVCDGDGVSTTSVTPRVITDSQAQDLRREALTATAVAAE